MRSPHRIRLYVFLAIAAVLAILKFLAWLGPALNLWGVEEFV
jgi:hypothetical protein